jgi:hypothetical protein
MPSTAPGAGLWWVVPEGTIGQLVQDLTSALNNPLTGGGTHIGAIVHVVESASTPAGAVAGPYAAESTAQSVADTYNGQVQSNLPAAQLVQSGANAIPGVSDIGDLAHRLTEASTWVRVGEVAVGVIILWAGIRAMTSGTPPVRTATAPARAAGRATGRTATRAGKAAATAAAPEIRTGARVAAKRIAPKTTKRVAAHREYTRTYGAKKPYQPSTRPKLHAVRKAS